MLTFFLKNQQHVCLFLLRALIWGSLQFTTPACSLIYDCNCTHCDENRASLGGVHAQKPYRTNRNGSRWNFSKKAPSTLKHTTPERNRIIPSHDALKVEWILLTKYNAYDIYSIAICSELMGIVRQKSRLRGSQEMHFKRSGNNGKWHTARAR
jgi:hypothetical protein